MGKLNSKVLKVAGLVALGIVGLVIYNLYNFKLTKITPKNNQEGVPTDQKIILSFNKELSPNPGVKTTINDVDAPQISIEGKKIIISPILSPYSEYIIKVVGVKSSSGKTIKDINLKFITGDLSANAKKVKQEFISSLPIRLEGFSIDYTVTNNTFNVEILQGPEDEQKKNSLDYLKKYFISPSTDKISFFVVPVVSGKSGP